MPAKGKHRRPKSQRFTRSIAVAGTGGAALALPLMGATGAHAATPQSAAVPSAERLECRERPRNRRPPLPTSRPTAKKAAAKTYAVRAGDSLSKIADDAERQRWLEEAVLGQPQGHRRRPVADPPGPEADDREGRRHVELPTPASSKSTPVRASKTGRGPDRPPAASHGHRAPAALRLHAAGRGRHRRHRRTRCGQHVVQRLPHRRRLRGPDRHLPQVRRRGHRRLRRLGRRVRQPGRHPARRRPVLAVRPPVLPLRLGRARP